MSINNIWKKNLKQDDKVIQAKNRDQKEEKL